MEDNRYEKALESLRSLFAGQAVRHCDKVMIEDIVNIFPELKEEIDDEKIRIAIINFLHEGNPFKDIKKETRQKWITWLEKRAEQKPIEWSKEDKERLRDTINTLVAYKEDTNVRCSKEALEDCIADIEWLRSLKDRMQPQPKQDWSEEDEKMYNEIILDLKVFRDTNCSRKGKAAYQREIDWLKSLRLPYYCDSCKLKKSIEGWKPSEEQMQSLEWIAKHYKGPALDDLIDIYNDLKKLIE